MWTLLNNLVIFQWRIQDFPRAPTPKVGLSCNFLPKTAWKLKNSYPQGWGPHWIRPCICLEYTKYNNGTHTIRSLMVASLENSAKRKIQWTVPSIRTAYKLHMGECPEVLFNSIDWKLGQIVVFQVPFLDKTIHPSLFLFLGNRWLNLMHHYLIYCFS